MQVAIDSMIRCSGVDAETMEEMIRFNTFRNLKKQQIEQFSRCDAGHLPDYDYLFDKRHQEIQLPRGNARMVFHLKPGLYKHRFDKRSKNEAVIPGISGLSLHDYQQDAMTVIGEKDQGIIVSPTGSGKTVMGLTLLHIRGQRSLVLVHNHNLARQWRDVIHKLLGLEAGIIGGGYWDEGNEITIATLQSLHRSGRNLFEWSKDYGLVMVDECHHICARTFGQVANQLRCYFRYGLTATRKRPGGQHDRINRYIGEELINIPISAVEKAGQVVPARVIRVDSGFGFFEDDYHKKMESLAICEGRNRLIAGIAEAEAAQHPTLILSSRIAHVEKLTELLPESVMIHGELGKQETLAAFDAVQQSDLVISTTGMMGEGVDVPNLSALIIGTPMGGTSEVAVNQAVGRVIRASPETGKDHAMIYDVRDKGVSKKAAENRDRFYAERGYSVTDLF